MKRKMKKVSSIILTAAMLLTTACADISTSQGNQSGVIGDTSGGVTESVGGNTVVENTPNKVDDTLPQCEPANLPGVSGDFSHSVMKGRDGYYYTAVLWSNDRESYVLNYYDLATGKSIPLCAKPQCMHGGNAFCTATGGGLFVDDVYESLYDGYIYKLGFIESDEAKCTLSVLKADLQGNELSKVADVFTAPLSDDDLLLPKLRSVVFHYGKMFVSMFTSKGTAKTSLYVIDLASGEVKEIVLSSPEKGTTEWIGATCSYMTADGDWLYYTMRNYKLDNSGVESEEHMSYNRTVLYRYNIKSGETEMVSAMPDRLESMEFVETEYTVKKYLKNDRTFQVNVATDDFMTVEPAVVNVHVSVSPLKVKKVQVPVTLVNFPTSLFAMWIPNEVELVFEVSEANYDLIGPSDFTVQLDYNDVLANKGGFAPLKLVTTSPLVKNVVLKPSKIVVGRIL